MKLAQAGNAANTKVRDSVTKIEDVDNLKAVHAAQTSKSNEAAPPINIDGVLSKSAKHIVSEVVSKIHQESLNGTVKTREFTAIEEPLDIKSREGQYEHLLIRPLPEEPQPSDLSVTTQDLLEDHKSNKPLGLVDTIESRFHEPEVTKLDTEISYFRDNNLTAVQSKALDSGIQGILDTFDTYQEADVDAENDNELTNIEVAENISSADITTESKLTEVRISPKVAEIYIQQMVEIEQFSSLIDTPIAMEPANINTLHEAGYEIPELPPICIEVAGAISELEPEPAEKAHELVGKITDAVTLVAWQRETGDENAHASEEVLQDLCIELFEHLGIEYTPESVMEFVMGIMLAKQAEAEIAAILAQKEDEGTHETKQEDTQNQGQLSQILQYPLTRTLGTLILQLTHALAA